MVTKKKRKSTKRKQTNSPEFAGIRSMEKTMETGMKTIGTVAVAGMGMALAGSVIGGLK